MPEPRHYILGTAGHIDHGKSALVRALTGTDPDRLPEEQRRGVTIELGFAHLTLPDPDDPATVFELGIVDVPGHADFVNNMVAGVGGMDLALFVVAADDGWMPQSEEHLHILTYLGIARAVVALTKSDLAEDVEFAAEFIRDDLAGTSFAEAPVIPVSAVTGEGLDALKSALAARLRPAPPPPDFGLPLLPVDRAFSVKGIGTVVTGTLAGGSLHPGDRLVLQPEGTPASVRSIQNHSRTVESAGPGMRTALNLPDLPLAARGRPGACRGALLTSPGAGNPVTTLNVLLRRLDREIRGQPATKRVLPAGRRVRVHHGSGAVGARLYYAEGRSMAPGESAVAQLRLDAPRFMMAGDRLVIRDWSADATLAGGVVLEVDARRRGWRGDDKTRFLAARASNPDDLDTLLRSTLERDRVLASGAARPRWRFSPDTIAAAIESLVANGTAATAGRYVVNARWWNDLLEKALQNVNRYHQKNSDLPGLPLAELRAKIVPKLPDDALFEPFLAALAERGVAQHRTVLARRDFSPSLPESIRAAAETLEARLRDDPLNPPGRSDLAPDPPSQRALSFLVRSGRAVHLSDKIVLHSETYQSAGESVLSHLRHAGPATASDLRQVLGTTRRILMPLLEHMDSEGLTRRDGDLRHPG